MPTISSVTPEAGPDEGGTELTITGSGFSAGTPVIDFEGLLAKNVVVNSDTELTCTTSRWFSVSPTTGDEAGGTAVTITGSGFNAFGDDVSDDITFGGASATNVTVVSDTEITCDTPAGTGDSDVVIIVDGDSSTRQDGFEYTASAAWTPADITTALWLDASDGGTLTVDGSDNVDQWDDKSGNARHATDDAGHGKPNYDSANNRIAFDRSNSEALKLASQPFSGTTPRTVVAVLNTTDRTGASNTVYSATDPSSFSPGEVWDFSIEDDAVYIRISGNDQFTPAVPSDADAIVAAQWESGSSSNSSVWHDGDQLTRSGGSSQTVNTKAGVAWIGFAETQADTYFDGYVYELIVISGALSTADREKLEGYLAHKWGLEANLPAGHTYKASPP